MHLSDENITWLVAINSFSPCRLVTCGAAVSENCWRVWIWNNENELVVSFVFLLRWLNILAQKTKLLFLSSYLLFLSSYKLGKTVLVVSHSVFMLFFTNSLSLSLIDRAVHNWICLCLPQNILILFQSDSPKIISK